MDCTIHCFLEFLPHVQAVQAVIRGNDDVIHKKLTFSSTSIFSQKQGRQKHLVSTWKNSSLPQVITNSISKVKYIKKEGLYVRFQTRSHDQSCDVKTIEVTSEGDRILNLFRINNETNVTISCRFCKQIHISERFCRALALPSSDWTDAVGDFFCHAHHNTEDVPIHTLSLVPKEGDILIGEEHVAILISDMKFIRHVKHEELSCARCHSEIGKVDIKTGTAWLYTTQIHIETHTLRCSQLETRQSSLCLFQHHISSLLMKMTRELNCFHFVVKSDEKQFLHLMSLDIISSVVTNTRKNLLTRHFKGTKYSTESDITECHVLKLFFQSSLKHSETIKNISNTIPSPQAETLLLSRKECQLLWLVLMDNHMSLPPSLRQANNMKVSYLQVLTEK